MKFSSKIEKCGLSPIRKFYPYQVECEKKGTQVYHLNIGQPDIKTPEVYFETIRKFDNPVLEYAPSPGEPVLIDAIRRYYKKLGVDYEKNDVVVSAGGSEGIIFTMATILDDGDEILIPEPFYPNYNTYVRTTGASIVGIQTKAEDGYKFADKAILEKYVTPHTKAIFINSPGNPSGVVLTPEECRVIADFAIEHDLFIVSDEVYREFIYNDSPLFTMAQFDDIADRLIIIDSISKRFSACGARVGCVCCKNKEFQQNFMKLCQARLSVPTIDQLAAAAMYDMDFSYFKDVIKEYNARRDAVCEELDKIPGASYVKPNGAFYLMAKLPVDDTDEFQKWLFTDFEYEGHTVMFAPGAGFYSTPGKGVDEIRIAYVKNVDYMRKAIQTLAKGIEAYNNRK